MILKKTLLAFAVMAAFPLARAQSADAAATARVEAKTHAQALVDRTVAEYPELLELDLHAVPPQGSHSAIVAARSAKRIGNRTDPDDLEVYKTGTPFIEVNQTGDQNVEVHLPLFDAQRRIVGVIELTFPYPPGSGNDKTTLIRMGEKIRDTLAPLIPQAASLAEPARVATGDRRAEPSGARRTVPPEALDDEVNKEALGNKQSLPMTKEVASGEALQNSQEGYTEAVKNQAGVSPSNSKGSPNDSINIRGIKLNLFSNYRLNGGLAIAGVVTTPTEDKERIETLKGANALMFGVASPAGIINLVTKRALDRDVTSVSLQGNSFGQYGAAVDLGRRFGEEKQLGVRANLSAAHLENGVRGAGGDSEFASIGADLKATSRLSFQLDLENYRRDVVEQGTVSLPAAVKGVIPIPQVPDPRNLLSGPWALYTPRTTNVQLRADYLLNDAWKVIGEIGRSNASRSRLTVRIGGYDVATGNNGIPTVNTVTQEYVNSFKRTELIGKFDTGPFKHDLTLGISSSVRDAMTPAQNQIVMPQRLNIYNPIALPVPVPTSPSTSLPLQDSKDTGLYVYDTIGWGPKWKFLAGLRQTRSSQDNQVKQESATTSSPALGVLYDIRPTTTLFASYMKGLEDGGVAPLIAKNAFEILAPGISTQKEIGIRDSYFKGVSISASYFDIKRVNAVTDPVTRIFANDGVTVFRGVETVVSADITRHWTVNAAAQWLHAVQHAARDKTIEGLVPENTPDFVGNLSVTHRAAFLPGLTLTAGAAYISKRPVNPQNQGFIPGYALFSAGAGYATKLAGRPTTFQLSIDNLTNKRYWNSVQTGTLGTGMDRSIRFNAKISF
ncbi:TonB-dependent receptor [Polaromonas jejuensis]|uniref:TonB-dependent receptor n=1 Tax=Polaromonas jejuensis TaxID=457502 RepID=A0ABW0Q907_9BURK|nr:TonB-dependent siderophore receptor [Polaromonas jejuensis]